MFYSLIHSMPTGFLQRTSNGIILNRFSFDIDFLDTSFMDPIAMFLKNSMNLVVTCLFIYKKMLSWMYIVPIVLYSLLVYRTRARYMAANREVTRMSLISKSPVIGTSVSSIAGGAVIRAIGCQAYLRKKIEILSHENSKNYLMRFGLGGWFSFQQGLWNTLFLVIPSSVLTLWIAYNSKVPGIDMVLLLSYLSQYSGNFSQVMEGYSLFELALVSLERLDQYEKLPIETGYKISQTEEKLFKDIKKPKLSVGRKIVEKTIQSGSGPGLFTQGRVSFRDVNARYPTGSSDVLKGIDLEIQPGQTVGIVGRTEAGKSSLTKLLWRALDAYKGVIEIDGIDIYSIDSKELRKQLNVVLQKPSVFEGTLLSNISRHPLPADRLAVIRQEMIDLGFPKDKLQERDLSYEVKESGSNLSQSEKQIICLMQAIEKKDSKVVILDEATSYVDLTMEKKFQKKISEAFKKSTVFIVAHKVSNVMDADRILVLDKGRIIQDGSPKELTEDINGAFYQIWKRR